MKRASLSFAFLRFPFLQLVFSLFSTPFFFRRQSLEKGFALLQFMIVVPVLITFTAAIVDFGIGLNTYNMLTRAVHEGVMYAARLPAVATPAGQALVRARIRETIANYAATTPAYNVELADADIVVESPAPGDPLADSVRVNIIFRYRGFFRYNFTTALEGIGPYLG